MIQTDDQDKHLSSPAEHEEFFREKLKEVNSMIKYQNAMFKK